MNKYAVALLASSAILAGCGGSDNDESNGTKNIKLDFAAKINSADLVCGENTETVGTAQTAANVTYFGTYISQLEVATNEGDITPVTLDESTTNDVERGISLISFCGTDLKNKTITGTVAKEADYTRVRFTIGVPEEHNHLDATNTDGILSKEIAMHWNWTAGYKHARLDANGWNIHLGSTACDGDGKTDPTSKCSNGNRPTYSFSNVNLSEDQIVLDYADLVVQSNISSNTESTPPGCMSGGTDPECTAIFTALGLDLATGQCKDNDCDSQTWVSIQKKD